MTAIGWYAATQRTLAMKKNFRKIPDSILRKLGNIQSDTVHVGIIFKVTPQNINEPRYSSLNLRFENDRLDFLQEFIPPRTDGSYCKKNLDGYKIKYPDRPKVEKTYYLGDRPIFGDYGKGTFPLYVTKRVIDYDEIPPKEISIRTELVRHAEENDNYSVIIKIYTTQILEQSGESFDDDLLFNLNILQECFGQIDVFATDANIDDYNQSLQVNWEIFPPGHLEENLVRITGGLRNLTEARLTQIRERYTFLMSLNPQFLITGASAMLRYFGAKFSDNLVVFENTAYGNAVYVLFENWSDLSRLSRTEIQSRPSDQFTKIRHSGNWQEKVRNIVEART